MTALPANVVPYQPPAASLGPLLPQTISEAMQLARVMSEARMVPDHLRGSPADCFLIVNQARLWRMDPFAVAQGTSFIHGKIMYEGKLTAAVVHSLGNLSGRLNYEFSGSGDNRTVVVSGTLRGEDKPRTVTVKLGDVKTTNGMWVKQPDQQLAYSGARVWARRHVPEVLLGVYTPEEFDASDQVTPAPGNPYQIAAPRIEQPAVAPKPSAPKAPLLVRLPGDAPAAQFPKTGAGLHEALEFMSSAVLDGAPEVVELNAKLLDWLKDKYPAMADDVAELRAAAVMAADMADAAELTDESLSELSDHKTDDPDDTFPGDLPSGTGSSLPPNH